MVLSIVALLWLSGLRPGPQVAADPSVPGPCATQSKTVQVGGDLETDFYYPAAKQCSGQITAPFPGIIFAHGFSMFGLSNGAADNADHGEHLASWGYVAAIPRQPGNAILRKFMASSQAWDHSTTRHPKTEP